MRVVLLGEMTGTRNGQEWPPRGSELDLPDDEARALIQGRMARPVVVTTTERAVLPDSDIEEREERRGPGRPRVNR